MTSASPAGSASRRRAAVRFRTTPTGPVVRRALRAVTALYLAVPLFALAAALDHPRMRSWPALWVTLTLAASLGATLGIDHGRLRRGAMAGFSPARALVQVVLATAAAVGAGLAFGLHGDTFLLLPVVTFLLSALLGNRAMVGRAFLVLVAGLGVETALQLPAVDALWATVLFAGTAGLLAVMVDHVVRGSISAMERNRKLAALATDTGALADWPRDLTALGERVAEVIGVARYAVLARTTAHAPLKKVFAWPEAGWPPAESLGSLARAAVDRMGAVSARGLLAAAAPAGTAAVVVVCPDTSRPGVPTEAALASTVAALVAAMLGRARLISGLVEEANTDELTGMANRRRLFDSLAREMARARRSRLPLTMAMIDLDHFKAYNDAFGHSAGDELLQRFAIRTASRVRAQDLLSRYGGEEFCMLLPETDLAGSTALLEGLRAEAPARDRAGHRVTFSAGLATWDGAESADELVARADAALYQAKACGRDRLHPPPQEAGRLVPAGAPGRRQSPGGLPGRPVQ